MYKSRSSSSFPKVRGGFSLFPTGVPQGVSGMGDTVDTIDFQNFLQSLPIQDQLIQQQYLAQNPPSVGYPSSVSSGFSFSQIPMAAWIAIGATGFFLFLYQKH